MADDPGQESVPEPPTAPTRQHQPLPIPTIPAPPVDAAAYRFASSSVSDPILLPKPESFPQSSARPYRKGHHRALPIPTIPAPPPEAEAYRIAPIYASEHEVPFSEPEPFPHAQERIRQPRMSPEERAAADAANSSL
ncbi:hypothetical protein B0H14DRAFT_2557389 [Mycena olivaceomarginata]|nr:hypothetical protein B0H14DRAFT_2557389 [Mycena olivaceomarginata]